MSDYKPGDPIADNLSSEAYPNCAFAASKRNLRAFFCRPKDFLAFGFLIKGVKTPGRVAEKRIALIQKEATNNGSSKRQENPYQTEGL